MTQDRISLMKSGLNFVDGSNCDNLEQEIVVVVAVC